MFQTLREKLRCKEIWVHGADRWRNAAMLEVGRAQRSIFLARYLRDRDLQRETESGLNVVENYNGAGDYIRFGKRGELASNRKEEQELGMLCLHILQSALVDDPRHPCPPRMAGRAH